MALGDQDGNGTEEQRQLFAGIAVAIRETNAPGHSHARCRLKQLGIGWSVEHPCHRALTYPRKLLGCAPADGEDASLRSLKHPAFLVAQHWAIDPRIEQAAVPWKLTNPVHAVAMPRRGDPGEKGASGCKEAMGAEGVAG